MAYLSNPATLTDYGVVQVGSNISVDSTGIISIPQSVATTATPTFAATTITGNELVGGTLGVTGITTLANSTASTTVSTGALVVTGGVGVGGSIYAGQLYDTTKRAITTVTPVAGTGITISSITGSGPTATFTISASGISIISATTVTTNYTVTATDEYIGVNSTNDVIITLPAGITGRTYTINDEHGSGTGKITITPNGTEKIQGSSTYRMSLAYQSVTLVFNSGAWRII